MNKLEPFLRRERTLYYGDLAVMLNKTHMYVAPKAS